MEHGLCKWMSWTILERLDCTYMEVFCWHESQYKSELAREYANRAQFVTERISPAMDLQFLPISPIAARPVIRDERVFNTG